MTHLSVNLNKVALLRNQRSVGVPSVTRAARIVVEAGADGVTVHPRPDERHIRATDVHEILDVVRGVELNVEGNPFEGKWLALVREVRPAQATLVPDAPGQATSDHGWDFAADGARLKPILTELRGMGIRTSVFIDPTPDAAKRAAETGADRVELYTESYASAFAKGEGARAVGAFARTALAAQAAGLAVNAGHDLSLANLGPFLRAVPGVSEVSIGHALIADAIEMGLGSAVRAYSAICRS